MSSAATEESFVLVQRVVCLIVCQDVRQSPRFSANGLSPALNGVDVVLPVMQPNSANKFIGRSLFLRTNLGHGALNNQSSRMNF